MKSLVFNFPDNPGSTPETVGYIFLINLIQVYIKVAKNAMMKMNIVFQTFINRKRNMGLFKQKSQLVMEYFIMKYIQKF